jgi:hypothetical protein
MVYNSLPSDIISCIKDRYYGSSNYWKKEFNKSLKNLKNFNGISPIIECIKHMGQEEQWIMRCRPQGENFLWKHNTLKYTRSSSMSLASRKHFKRILNTLNYKIMYWIPGRGCY